MKEVADQSHILGLNAAIEERTNMGGFEVAAEIRKLASMPKDSLKSVEDRLSRVNRLLSQVRQESELAAGYAEDQAASAQRLLSFVRMIEEVTQQLEHLRNESQNCILSEAR